MLPNAPHSPPRHANAPTMYQSTPFKYKASGYKAQKAEVVGFQENRKAMCKEMTGFWVGPCELPKFFELTMPIGTETQEKLPDISTKFFSGLKPTKEKDLYPRLIKFCGKDNPNFPEIKLVDTSAHPDPDSKDGAKVKQDVTAYDNNLTIDENSPTRLGDAQFGVEVKDSLIELFYDGGKPKFETMDDAPFETNTDIGKKTRGQLVTYAVEICARQHRTHLFFVYIYFPFARFIRFDRSGALVSKRFDFTKDCTPLVRFFHRFSKMTPAERGYDPTVRVASKEEYAYARALLNDWAPKHERPVLKMDYEEGDAEDEEATGGKGKRNVVHFGDEIGLGAKQPLEFTQSAPITHFVADMLKLLGERLKRLPTIGEDPEEDTKVEAMYRDVESIWAATLSSSSWPQSDRGKSQLLKKRGTPDDSQEDDSEERKSKKVKTWHI
ncbi:hypothetical protein EYR38_003318 [Pleurotus pulmonarius]|nr:hypothetical protein EYR38_003318 [Pleurotus pulmonarius]